MIKSKKQMYIIISVFALILFLGGTTYAWFSYSKISSNNVLVAGDIYLTFDDGNNTISLEKVFPETKEEARAKNNNYITFDISGVNESNKTLYYEIDLDHGTDKNSPYIRFNDKDLRFDLVELDSQGNEVKYLLDNVGYDTLVNKRIWADSIEPSTSVEVSRKYKLRMWLDGDVIVSDTDPNKDYPATTFKNYYGNVKVTVIGDFTEKLFGYQKVMKAIERKENQGGTCSNITYEEDGITYLSGTNDCVDMNYVWYSGKLWRITAFYPDGAMKLVTENNITSIAFNASGQVNFYTDANTTSYMYQWLNEDFYDTLYNPTDFIDTTRNWNATNSNASNNSGISTKLSETTMVTANVGLLNSYEYYNSYRCIDSSSCTRTSSNTGYLIINYKWWLLNPYNASNIWFVNDNSSFYQYPNNGIGVRPSIVIKSGLEFTGDGTSSSPYKIVGDKESGTSNELVNTRLSGEYVKLKNGNNEQVFRIIGVEDNKTKIIAMDYADNKATKKFATSTGTANTLWGSGTTTDTDTWYTYLNDNSTGYLKNLKDSYGELFDSGLYYLGTSGYNYKLSVCANTTSGNTKICDKTSDKGTFNIGLPRYGEMFATQQSRGYSNSINMWLINRNNDASYVWVVGIHNYAGIDNPTQEMGARPTLHLKSTVKIISGTGLPNDPYVVGLLN